MLRYACAVSGNNAEARRVLDRLDGLSKERYVPPGSVAVIYAALGEKDQAFEWLDKAYADRSILSVGRLHSSNSIRPSTRGVPTRALPTCSAARTSNHSFAR